MQSAGAKKTRAAGFLLALLLLTATLFAQAHTDLPPRTYSIVVNVKDALDRPVSDVLVLLYTSPFGSNISAENQNQKVLEEYTGLSGRARISLKVGANQSTPSAYLKIYTPYWASSPKAITLPDIPTANIEEEVTIPLVLSTYRLRIIDENGNPLQGVQVQISSPFPLSILSDANGFAQVRMPAGSNISGFAFYKKMAQNFSFVAQALNKSEEGKTYELLLKAPFKRKLDPWNKTWSWDARIFDSMGRPLMLETIWVSCQGMNFSFRTDRDGWVHLRQIPSENASFIWLAYNYTYVIPLNLSLAGPKLQMPLLISLSDPAKAELGESCYRIDVNVTDARNDPALKVNAKPLRGGIALPFTLDKRAIMQNSSGMHFSRILCVDADTGFEIIASNTFESTKLQIELKFTTAAAPVQPIYTKPPPPGVFGKSKAADSIRLETLLILFYVLFVLIVLLLAVHFKSKLIYYGQAILRFTYTSYQDRQAHDEEAKKLGGEKGDSSLQKK
jgi:hypothetical protein